MKEPSETRGQHSTLVLYTRRKFLKKILVAAAYVTPIVLSYPKYFRLLNPSMAQAASLPGGLPIPSLDDERDTYRRWGWTWTTSTEPNFPSDASYFASNPNLHNDTEGDDLWTYLMMYRRTSQGGYLDRANAWARYFKNDYRNCVGNPDLNFCYDRSNFGLDHLYGWGLVAFYEFNGDAAALAETENLAAIVEGMYAGSVPGQADLGYYGLRAGGRHLLLATRVAEATGNQRWSTLRDKLIDLWLQSSSWDATRGMYFVSAEQTAYVLGSSAYGSGIRIQSAFQIGVLAEALYHAYRTTRRTDVKNRLVAMARFVDQFGVDPTYQYTGSWFGHQNGTVWHNYSAGGTASFWDPVYTISLVNTLVLGYKYTGDGVLLNRAKHFFNRGTKGVYGSPTQRTAPDNQVHHFVDTIFDSSAGNFYLSYNKGELQYTHLLFENGGSPTVEGGTPPSPPAAPTNLTIN